MRSRICITVFYAMKRPIRREVQSRTPVLGHVEWSLNQAGRPSLYFPLFIPGVRPFHSGSDAPLPPPLINVGMRRIQSDWPPPRPRRRVSLPQVPQRAGGRYAARVTVLVAVAASLLIAGAPVLFLRLRGAEWRWFWLGIASWALALVPKVILAIPIELGGLPAEAQGILGGLVSAGCELGMAALFLRRRTWSTANVRAFGAGIGSFEVLFALGLASIEAVADAMMPTRIAMLFFLLERVIALVGHVASRVLVYVALRAKQLLPAVVALVVFAFVDGTASYGVAAGWDWDRVAVRASFLLFIAVAGTLEAGVAWWAWRRARSRWNQCPFDDRISATGRRS